MKRAIFFLSAITHAGLCAEMLLGGSLGSGSIGFIEMVLLSALVSNSVAGGRSGCAMSESPRANDSVTK